jgi:serine/threonine protein kinase
MGVGERAYFSAGNSDDGAGSKYTIFRMRKMGDTSSAAVFQARHSQYPEQVIVVKVFKRRPERDLITQGRSWRNEYKIHFGLQSVSRTVTGTILVCCSVAAANENEDNIVKLLGGDARISALFLESIDARDLTHRSWCGYSDGRIFKGTTADAKCVLHDMARALQYLRVKKIKHNDIKPANILYSGEKAVLIDFGLGTFDGAPTSRGGTPWYVAPEYRYTGNRGGPSDMWALGIVMLYLLKRLALPDAGVEVPSWPIKDIVIVQSPSLAQARMIQ